MDDKEKERQKRIDEIRKQIHPHDDEPDPTAYMGNYNFPQMLFAFCLGFVTMFVLSVNEINEFKGCPSLHISMNLFLRPLENPNDVTWSIVVSLLILLAGTAYYIYTIMSTAFEELDDERSDK